MKIRQKQKELTVNNKLLRIFEKEITASGIETKSGVVIHFRDPKYSSETGGFHPVEVAINNEGNLQYITDFAYAGIPPFVELEKELDFDFGLEVFQQYGIEYRLQKAREIYDLWERNFICYCNMGVYIVSLEAYL